MAFEKAINKTIEVGAYSIEFLDDSQIAILRYAGYEDGEVIKNGNLVNKVSEIRVPFSELSEKDLEGFNTVMGYIQTLCDDYNPENPDNIVEDEAI